MTNFVSGVIKSVIGVRNPEIGVKNFKSEVTNPVIGATYFLYA